ncbi:MAG TPA: MFS transporter [Nocardioidaceae bacterium]|nr:MFS transporter [Nocardioidaceae bacterium]
MERSRFALLAGLAIDNFGSGLFLPLALVYATRVVGLPVGTAGPAVALGTILGFAIPPVAGRLTHRFGPRFTVVTAQLVQGMGAAAYLVAADVAGVLVAAGLMATGVQMFYCSVFVLIADVSTDESKERPFALVAMVRAAAFGLGTLTSALALTQNSDAALRGLVAVDAGTFVVAAFLLARFVVTGPVEHAAVPAVGPLTVLRDRSYVTLMLGVCLLGLTVDFALLGTPVFVLDVLHGPAWLPGALLAAGTLLSSVFGVKVVEVLAGRRRTRSLQAGAVTYAVFSLALMATLWVPPGWLVPYAFAAWLLFVIANKVIYPVAGALSDALPPRNARAGYMATFQYSFTTAQVVAPAVVGLFAVAAWAPWAVIAVAALAGVVTFRSLEKAIPGGMNRAEALASPG